MIRNGKVLFFPLRVYGLKTMSGLCVVVRKSLGLLYYIKCKCHCFKNYFKHESHWPECYINTLAIMSRSFDHSMLQYKTLLQNFLYYSLIIKCIIGSVTLILHIRNFLSFSKIIWIYTIVYTSARWKVDDMWSLYIQYSYL